MMPPKALMGVSTQNLASRSEIEGHLGKNLVKTKMQTFKRPLKLLHAHRSEVTKNQMPPQKSSD
jgi:hypothetical protein